MLELRNIQKSYTVGSFYQTALDGVSLAFRDNEFVAILGPSGSGKTTLLNLVGGLDRYDSGDLLIDGKSTADFSEAQWDRYRNHAVGFIFQNYNLIGHSSVLSNVETGMTLSGLSTSERRKRAYEVLERVGLKEHVHKRPNQLSGGQMQRVAIARALANDPDIILADEPTGSIDSETARQIMELIQEIAKEKLVILVTHDEHIAETYAERTIKLSDGKVTGDSHPYEKDGGSNGRLSFTRTAMAFTQAIRLSFNNLRTKKVRTAITAFAGSIGIVGVALVLALANGMNQEIDDLERTTLSEFPIQIEEAPIDFDALEGGPQQARDDIWEDRPDTDVLYPYDDEFEFTQHFNDIDEEFLTHLEDIDDEWVHEVSHVRGIDYTLLKDTGAGYDIDAGDVGFSQSLAETAFFEDNYDMLAGEAPEDESGLLLIVDRYNRISENFLEALGMDTGTEEIEPEEFLGRRFLNPLLDERIGYDEEEDRYYRRGAADIYADGEGIELEIEGIARPAGEVPGGILDTGLKYHPDLETAHLEHAEESEVVEAQQADPETNIFTGYSLNESDYEDRMQEFGADATPKRIDIYPVDFEAKNEVVDYLDEYNEDREEDERIVYTDFASIITDLSGDVIDSVSYVLIGFSAISLVVSSIMIGIITYVSVLERTKEIGILRSLGARKRDISRVFNAESVTIGFVAGFFGVLVAYLLTFPINRFIARLVDGVENLASMPVWSFVGLIILSVFLTFVAGLIPARIAARKDPVKALRVD